jgi:transketolase
MPEPQMRDVYTDTLIEMAEKDPNIVVLEADLMAAHGTKRFQEKFPARIFNVGVAEANLVGVAAGLSLMGKIPFAATFGCFAARRAYDQFFVSANYARLNVKLVGTDPGIIATYNGGTHMAFEDTGLMRNIPNLIVFEPCDLVSLRELMRQSAYHYGCTYMRLPRGECEVVYNEQDQFQLGRGKVLIDGNDIVIFASGSVLVNEALRAADVLRKENIEAAVIDIHTIKPLDADLVLEYAEKTNAVLTCENHQIYNGLGSAVAEVLSERRPTLMKRIGVRDEFGEVGELSYLQQRYGLTAHEISEQAKSLLEAKR